MNNVFQTREIIKTKVSNSFSDGGMLTSGSLMAIDLLHMTSYSGRLFYPCTPLSDILPRHSLDHLHNLRQANHRHANSLQQHNKTSS